jgi:pimeloyl-ACP methyl ester carboxylesterase
MKQIKRFSQIIWMIVFSCLMVIGTQAQSSVEGYWAGGSNLFGRNIAIQAHIEKTPTGFTGHFSAPAWNAAKRVISNIQFDGTKLRFEFPSSTMIPFVCQAELKDEILQGTLSRGSETGNFHLVRAATFTQKQYDEYVGGYRAEKGEDWLVTWGAFGKLRILSLDGNGDALFPLSENKFFLGRSVINSPKPEGFVTFSKDEKGHVTGLTFKVGNQPEQKRIRAEIYNQEQVSFYNGKVKLAGTLLLPPTKLRHSAMVLVHGSQDRSRDDDYEFMFANIYLKLGIAVLIFDKRGVGASTGDWHYASMDDLAEDVLAGVRYLKTRPDINPKQIGLRGVSAGGWVAPLAAARSKDIAYLVTISAAGVSPAEQVTHDQLRKAKEAGVTEAELMEAEKFFRLQFDAVRSEKAWANFQAAIPAARDKAWFRFTLGDVPKESWLWESTRLTVHFDPIPFLQKIKCPTLLLFGELDPNYPAAKSAANMERALKMAGNKDITVHIFPKANHSLQVLQPDGKLVGVPMGEVETDWAIKRINVNF